MARGDAEKAIDIISDKLGKHGPRSSTETTPVAGGDIDNFEELVTQASSKHKKIADSVTMRALIHNYGTKYENILAYKDDLVTLGKTSVLRAEVRYAIEQEMVSKLSDIVFRRTDLGTGSHPGDEAINECAEILAQKLGWSAERRLSEIDEVNARYPNYD
jgi:glycerol-3-phosphate dehydrogenase